MDNLTEIEFNTLIDKLLIFNPNNLQELFDEYAELNTYNFYLFKIAIKKIPKDNFPKTIKELLDFLTTIEPKKYNKNIFFIITIFIPNNLNYENYLNWANTADASLDTTVAENINIGPDIIKEFIESWNNFKPEHKSKWQEDLLKVFTNGLEIQYFPDLQNNFDICITAVRQNGMALEYCSEDMQSNRDICFWAVEQNGMALQFVLYDFENDNCEIAYEAVTQNGMALEFAENCNQDYGVCEEAVKQNGLALQFCENDLIHDIDIYDFENDYCAIAYQAVTQNGMALEFSGNCNQDYGVCEEAVKQNGLALQFCDNNLIDDINLCMAAVYQNGLALQYCRNVTDGRIPLQAVINDGMALEFSGIEYKWNANERIVEEAFKQCFKSLQFAHNDLLSNPDFIRKLVILHPIAIKYADKTLRMNVDFITELYTNIYPEVIHLIKSESILKPTIRATSTPENIEKYEEWTEFKQRLDESISQVKPQQKNYFLNEDGSPKHYMHKIDLMCTKNKKAPSIKDIKIGDPDYQDLFNPISIHDIDEEYEEDEDDEAIFADLFPNVNANPEAQVNELSLNDIQDIINSEELEGFLSHNIYEGTPWYNVIDLFKDSPPIEHTLLLTTFIDYILIEYQHTQNTNMAQPDVEEDYYIFIDRVREFKLILHTINNILISIEYFNPLHYIQMKQFLKLIETQEQDFDITRIIEILTEIKTYF
jgi:hypothetical protein